MRKTVVAAVAALAAAGGATAAVAQTTTPAQLTVTVKPVKAGTKKKPRNSSIHLRVVNNDEKRTLQRLTITIPKTLELSGKGFKTCSESFLNSNGTSGCPKGSKVGRGSADAVVGVNGPTQTPLHFDVTAFVGGKNRINFYLHSTGTVKVDVVAPGRVAGRKLTVTVPQVAQEPVPNVWAGLVRLDTTLKGRAKKHLLIASAGCKGGKQRFSAVLTFADNGVSPAGTVPTSGSAKCSK